VSEFTIRILRTPVAKSEATLVEHLVDEGDPLIVIATEKVETEIVAGA